MKKRGETYFGYKDHVVVCQKTKFVRDYEVTSASVHDSRVAVKLLKRSMKEGELVWEDAGYVGTEEGLRECGIVPIVCEKGFKGHPLKESQKANNRVKSSTRSRVENVFGFMEQSMMGLVFRGVGMVRAKANVTKMRAEAKQTLVLPNVSDVTKCNIAMTNLVYNMCRLAQIKAYHADYIVVK